MVTNIREDLALSLLRASERLVEVINEIRRRKALDLNLNKDDINELKLFETKLAEARAELGLQPKPGDCDLIDLDIECHNSTIPPQGLKGDELIRYIENLCDDLNLEEVDDSNAKSLLFNICLKQQEAIEDLNIEMEEVKGTLTSHCLYS